MIFPVGIKSVDVRAVGFEMYRSGLQIKLSVEASGFEVRSLGFDFRLRAQRAFSICCTQQFVRQSFGDNGSEDLVCTGAPLMLVLHLENYPEPKP